MPHHAVRLVRSRPSLQHMHTHTTRTTRLPLIGITGNKGNSHGLPPLNGHLAHDTIYSISSRPSSYADFLSQPDVFNRTHVMQYPTGQLALPVYFTSLRVPNRRHTHKVSTLLAHSLLDYIPFMHTHHRRTVLVPS